MVVVCFVLIVVSFVLSRVFEYKIGGELVRLFLYRLFCVFCVSFVLSQHKKEIVWCGEFLVWCILSYV